MWTFEVMKAKMADTPIGKDDEALRRIESMVSDCKDISEGNFSTIIKMIVSSQCCGQRVFSGGGGGNKIYKIKKNS